MNITELENFNVRDAINFHGQLNPKLFVRDKLDDEVREQLLIIARDFMDHLGVKDIEVKDITLSGSNAAYTYTPHSDIDLHILVDIGKLKNDEVYRELFTSKKIIYNDTHDIKIRGYDVELYVQDYAEPVKSLGEYSVKNDKWIKYPSKNRSNFDERGAREKFKKLIQLTELALRSKDLSKLDNLLQTIHKYRRAGLSKFGEFGAENLAYKALRSRGILDQLYNHRDELHSDSLSLDEGGLLSAPTLNPDEIALKHKVSKDKILQQLVKGIIIELEHTDDSSVAREIALDHLAEDPYYYTKLKRANLESIENKVNEGASGYIPSDAEKNDPRFKTALTVDIKPDSIKKNAKKLGLGNIARSGIPPTANANGKV